MRQTLTMLLFAFALWISACSGGIVETPIPVESAIPMETMRSFDPDYTITEGDGIKIFSDSITGISLDFPGDWLMDQVRGGLRSPSVFVFTNYRAIPSLIDKIEPEDTVIYLTIPQPRPDGSLIGLIDSYRQAWAEEGSSIVSEQEVTLNSGEPGKMFILDSHLGRQYYYLFTQAGERFVFIEAYGALEPVTAIALSIR